MFGIALGILITSCGIIVWSFCNETKKKQLEDEARDRFYSVAYRIGRIGQFHKSELHGSKPILGLRPPLKDQPKWTYIKYSKTYLFPSRDP